MKCHLVFFDHQHGTEALCLLEAEHAGCCSPYAPAEFMKTGWAPKYWTATVSGGAIDLDDPKPEQILLSDVAHGLANVARWNGQSPCRISVAEHSIIVAQLALNDLTLDAVDVDAIALVQACLMHDTHEAYPPGDVAGPLKAYLRTKTNALDVLMRDMQRAIELRFGLPGTGDAQVALLVHRYDMQARWLERDQLLVACERGWGETLERPRDPHPRIECFDAETAEELFLEWCHDWGIR